MMVIAKLIGALYRVPLTNTVGAEGMGLYQMVFPLYTVLLAFCGGGFTSAISRVVAKYTSRGDDETALRAVKAAVIPLTAVSALSAGAVIILRNIISGIQGNTEAGIAYLALAPSLLFAGGINVIRGYFQGKSMTVPSGVSQLAEQVIKLALGLYLARILLPRGVKYAVAGALIGVSASELVALIYLVLRFFVFRRRRKIDISRVAAVNAELASDNVIVTDRMLLKEIYSFALPVTLGSLVLPITQIIDSALVINILMHGGQSRDGATALFGLFVGPVGTLINMPTVVVVAVAVAFLPALTSSIEKGSGAEAITRTAAKWIMLFVLPITLAFMFFPDRIVNTLYRRGLTDYQLVVAARLLGTQAIGVFYVGVLQIATAVLQAHNRSHVPVINLTVGACVKVGLTPVLVRFIGITGASVATAACYGVAAALTVRAAYKIAPLGCDIKQALLLPLAFSLAACGAFYLTVRLASGLPYLWQTVVGAGVALIVYSLSLLFELRTITEFFRKRKRRKFAEK